MKKIGRNEPCPCGSGKKYKKCCLKKTAPKQTFVYTDLDQLSNQVPTLIQQGKLDEAEEVCQSLMDQFPEQIDGIHRYAEVYEAKGNMQKASEYYRKTAEFAQNAGGFGEESIQFFLQKAEGLAKEGSA